MSALTRLPAFRVCRGDTIRHNNRRATVVAVSQVAFYPRNGGPVDHGVKLTLRYEAGGRAEVTRRNGEIVKAYR